MNTLHSNLVGQKFQDFHIIECIGRGGMGSVYKAMQISLDREVAVKIIPLDTKQVNNQEILERLQREAKLAASLQHPNIVSIYSAGWWEEKFFIAMEYVRGETLQQRIYRSPLSEIATWEIGTQLCSALECANLKGITHRDIKPANIILTEQGIPKLADFGLSKKQSDPTTTRFGVILGTPSYMSPEQVACQPTDFRSDMYGLGATLYHAVTGYQVFKAGDIAELMYKHRYEIPMSPEQYVPGLSSEGSKILLKLLAKKPEDRYPNYAELKNAFRFLILKLTTTPALKPSGSISRKIFSPLRAFFQRAKAPNKPIPTVNQPPVSPQSSPVSPQSSPVSPQSSKQNVVSNIEQISCPQPIVHVELPATQCVTSATSDSPTQKTKISPVANTKPFISQLSNNQTNILECISATQINTPATAMPECIAPIQTKPVSSSVLECISAIPINTPATAMPECIAPTQAKPMSSSVLECISATQINAPAQTNALLQTNTPPLMWKILIYHPDHLVGEQLATGLNETGKFMAVAALQEHDVVTLLEVESFQVYIYIQTYESSEMPLYESIQHIFPDIHQIVMDNGKNYKNVAFILEKKVAFIPKFDLLTILQIIQQWQYLVPGITPQ